MTIDSRPALTILAIATIFASCDGQSNPRTNALRDPQSVARNYMPLDSEWSTELTGTVNGLPRSEIEYREPDQRVIDGEVCVPCMQEVYDNGSLVEVSVEWHVKMEDGSVWKFGEESRELVNGAWNLAADSWLAGEGSYEAHMVMPSNPQVGDVWLSATPTGIDFFEVLSTNDQVKLDDATYQHCLRVVENPGDVEDQDIIIYAPEAGRVAEISTTGRIDIVTRRRR